MPLTRWSLDRLSAYVAERDLVISPMQLWRLLAQAGLSFQRTRFWKASPDPEYETTPAWVLELYAAAPFDGPVISSIRWDDQSQTDPGSGLGAAQTT